MAEQMQLFASSELQPCMLVLAFLEEWVRRRRLNRHYPLESIPTCLRLLLGELVRERLALEFGDRQNVHPLFRGLFDDYGRMIPNPVSRSVPFGFPNDLDPVASSIVSVSMRLLDDSCPWHPCYAAWLDIFFVELVPNAILRSECCFLHWTHDLLEGLKDSQQFPKLDFDLSDASF